MQRAGARVAAAIVAVLLLVGLGPAFEPTGARPQLAAAAAGHDAVVGAAVQGVRLATLQPAVAAAPADVPTFAAPGARAGTDGPGRLVPPHLAASTGDRAPPALP